MRFIRLFLQLAGAVSVVAAPAFAQSVAFRVTDLDLRDPHVFVRFIGCNDATDNFPGFSFNGQIQTQIQTDGDGDGYLDLSYLVIFDPLDQAGPGGPIRIGRSSCTAPEASTTCGPPENLTSLSATNSTMGQCLEPLAGTTRPYTPAITSTSAPCFVSAEATLTAEFLDGVPLTLRRAEIAATYIGSPATGLVTGLVRGFLTQADADNTIIPNNYPLIGGMRLSSLFPGGTDNCAGHSDKDVNQGTSGWWMYFNFSATEVAYTGPQLSVGERDGSALALLSANPSRLPLRLEYRLAADGPARLSVHDLSGRRVAELASLSLTSGTHTLTWDGRLDGGGSVRPGLYMIRLETAKGAIARRVVLLR